MAQQQGQQDNSLDGLLAIGAIIAAFVIIWFLARNYIIQASFFYWKIQLFVIGLFTNGLDGISDFMSTTEVREVTWEMYSTIGSSVAKYTKWLAIAGLLFMAKKVYDRAFVEKLKRSMDMDALAVSEEKIWPQIAPLTDLHLSGKNADEGPWASAMKNRQFAHANKLFNESGEIDKEKATNTFIDHLDKPLSKLSKMSPQRQAAFALFASKVCDNDDLYKEMIRTLAESTKAGKTDYSCIKPALKLYGKCEDKRLKRIVRSHSYELTMLMSLLQVARGAGILNDSDFIGWMKPQDRLLWYTVNQTGRRVSWAEAGGVKAHWLAEVVAKRRIEDPMVDEAVEALVEACSETMDIAEDAEFKYRY